MTSYELDMLVTLMEENPGMGRTQIRWLAESEDEEQSTGPAAQGPKEEDSHKDEYDTPQKQHGEPMAPKLSTSST